MYNEIPNKDESGHLVQLEGYTKITMFVQCYRPGVKLPAFYLWKSLMALDLI